MKSFRSQIPPWTKPDVIYIAMVYLIIVAQLFAIGSFSYLGIFNRPIADDYCESAMLKRDSILSVVFQRYEIGAYRASNRYSTLMFVGLSQMLGKYHMQILPSLMMLLWLAGLTWSINQFRKLLGIRLPVALDYLAAACIVFFSVWQAPNRFQTFLWRASMSTHFAPLVLLSLFSGFMLSQINQGRKPSIWISLVIFLASFLLGGFSEPPTAVVIVMMIFLLLPVWRWNDDRRKKPALNLILWSLAGFIFALFALFFSPGNLSHGASSFAKLFFVFGRSFRFTHDFWADTVRTMPFPTLVSILTSFFISFVFHVISECQPLDPQSKRRIWAWLLIAPLFQSVLIAASFAPSAYGQSYPAERAQFLGRLIMTMTLLFEGVLLGTLCAHSKIFVPWRRPLFLIGSLALFFLAFYPMRAGSTLLADVPKYRQWASAWDLRETEIERSIAMGERDLVVRLLPTKEGVKEIDADIGHWVNQCVANDYEVDTVRSVPMGNQ